MRDDTGGDRQNRAEPRGKRRRSPPARANVTPFPLASRHTFVKRLASQVASHSIESGEAHMLHQVLRQGQILERKGVRPRMIKRELRALTATVRAELWRLVILMGSQPQ
jgi:hypothetical protein